MPTPYLSLSKSMSMSSTSASATLQATGSPTESVGPNRSAPPRHDDLQPELEPHWLAAIDGATD